MAPPAPPVPWRPAARREPGVGVYPSGSEKERGRRKLGERGASVLTRVMGREWRGVTSVIGHRPRGGRWRDGDCRLPPLCPDSGGWLMGGPNTVGCLRGGGREIAQEPWGPVWTSRRSGDRIRVPFPSRREKKHKAACPTRRAAKHKAGLFLRVGVAASHGASISISTIKSPYLISSSWARCTAGCLASQSIRLPM